MAHTQPRRGFICQLAMALNGDDLVGRRKLSGFDVRAQFLERLVADAAGPAVFEQKGPVFRSIRRSRPPARRRVTGVPKVT